MQRRSRSLKRRRVASRSRSSKRLGRGSNGYVRIAPRLPTTFTGGDTIVRRFRRLALDSTLLPTGAGGVALLDSQGNPTTWAAISGVIADNPVAPGLLQFGMAIQIKLKDLVNYTQLQVLFNEYQINKVELHFWMDNAPAYGQGNGANPSTVPSVFICTDPNDSIVPGTQDLVTSRGDVQFHSLQRPFVYTFYPKPAMSTFVNGLASGYAQPNQSSAFWLDTSPPSDAIETYGVKMWWRHFNSAGSVGLGVRIQPVVYTTFRRIR